jgi:putative ABC transport system permease protein
MRPEHWIYTVPLRLRSLVHRQQADQELDQELQYHVECKTEENILKGLTPQEARRTALLEMGGVEKRKEECRDTRRVNWMQNLLQDIRYGLRMLRKSPGFAAVAVLTLALGIGANTTIFSVVNAVLIRPLPYMDPARLVAFSSVNHEGGAISTFPTVSLNEVEEWRRESRAFESIGSFVFSALPVSVGEQSMFLVAVSADPELLATLGVEPAVGRNFSGSGSSLKDPSVIISHKIWVEAFHSDPAAIGRSMVIDGDPFTVTGVLPGTFQFPRPDASYDSEDPDILFPVANIADMWGRNFTQWLAIGRLKPGVTTAQAETELQALTSRLLAQDADLRGLSVHLSALDTETTSKVRSPLLLTMGISIVLMLIACTNIMNLLFSRAAARGREMAVRKAVGATTGRLIRQMLTESACLTCFSGIVGVGLARISLDALVSISPAHLPISGRVEIDLTVLGFAFLVCAVAAFVAGVLPALHRSRQTENLIHAGTRTSGGGALVRFQRSLMVTQMALGVGLLAAAGLLVHSLLRLSAVNPGFRTAGVLGFELTVPSSHSDSAAARDLQARRTQRLFQRMLEQTRSIPGVLSAGWITNLPPETRSGMFLPFSVVGAAAQASKSRPYCNFQITSEDYFQTVGVPLARGRDFTSADALGAPPVMIVNETLARQYFGATDALGQKIITMFDSKDAPRQIVGIIRDTHDRGLNAESIATSYIPYEQFAQAYGAIAVRTNMPPETIFPEIRKRMAQIDPTVPLKNLTTIRARLHKTLDEPRFYTVMAVVCALMAMLFVTLGLYGVVAYSVARRTSEIGIRMALGAPRNAILRGVLWQGLQMAAFGVVIGLALSLIATRVLAKFLFEIKPNDPTTLAAAAGLVLLVTLAASYIPARRASRVDPIVSLRYE